MTALTHIMLELAREPGHPTGDRNHGYHLYLPLTGEGKIDVAAWKQAPASCRVRRFRPNEEEAHGRVRLGRNNRWIFDYDGRSEFDDEMGFRLGDEPFVPGEYVSIREDDGKLHTFQVVSARPE